MSFHFGLLGLHFLSFWPFGPSFPFILAFWAFICLLGFHFLSFWPFGPSFPFILAFWAFISFHCGLSGLLRGVPPTSCQKWLVFLMSHIKNLTAPGPALFAIFGLLGLHFLLFWPFWALLLCFRLLGLLFYFVQNRLRTRADQSPSPWPTKPGENSAKPPTGRPRSKPMGHQTWRKLHAYGSSVEKTAKGQTKVQTHGPPNLEKIARLRQQCRRDRQRADQSPISISQLTCFKMKTVRCSARQCTLGRSHVLEGLTPKLNPKPVKVKMRVERQRGRDTQKQSERAMQGGACQPTNSPPLSRDYVWTP